MCHGAGPVVIAFAVLGLSWLMLGGGGGVGSRVEQAEATSSPPRPAARHEPAAGKHSVQSPGALVDRVMLVGFDGSGPEADIVSELGNHHYGGVLIGASNWQASKADGKLTDALRASVEGAGLPAPLIAIDQEGGDNRTLSSIGPETSEADIGAAADAGAARDWAEAAGVDLARAGIDLNLAPIADVGSINSPVAGRTFSDDAGVVAAMTAAAVQGCERAGVACAVAHFPGLGAASQDTDEGPATVGLDAATLRRRDLVPFRAAFAADAPAVVVSHGLYAAFDPITPASLSPTITTDMLRDELGFQGVAISDDLDAGALSAGGQPGRSAVSAINAGIDLVQVSDPGDVKRVRLALLEALRSGEISESRMSEAAGRVGTLARSLGAKD